MTRPTICRTPGEDDCEEEPGREEEVVWVKDRNCVTSFETRQGPIDAYKRWDFRKMKRYIPGDKWGGRTSLWQSRQTTCECSQVDDDE